MCKWCLVLCFALALLWSPLLRTAYALLGAGDVVFDPAAFQRQLINYALSLNQYSTQTLQYSTQIQQLENEYTNMRSLGYKVDLSNLDQVQEIIKSALGISNDHAKMQGQFQKLYPDFATYQRQKSVDYARQSAEWSKQNQQNARDILTVTTKVHESIAQDQRNLKYLSNRSDSASGTKDLLQTLNQLLIMQTKQLMQLQQIIATSAKADAAYLAERVSGDEASRAASGNLFRDWTEKGSRTIHPNAHFLK